MLAAIRDTTIVTGPESLDQFVALLEGRLWFAAWNNQVKIRRPRIELEEIDLAVQSIPGVRRAATVVVPAAEGGESNNAFVADRTIAAEEVYALCKQKLPIYMEPARIFQLDDLPRNANGKLDRRATRDKAAQAV